MIFYRSMAALIGVVSLNSCSWLTTFAVINASSAPITISYTLGLEATKVPPCPNESYVDFPRVVEAKDIDTLVRLQKDAPRAEFTCDKTTRTVMLSLAPEYAASLFRVSGYTGPDSERDYLIDLSKLTIQGERGELQYAGRQLLRDFEKDSVALWILTYK